MFWTFRITTADCEWQKADVVDVVETVLVALKVYISAIAALSLLHLVGNLLKL